jgi:DNA-binding NarL/FixJ family response regulator
MATRILIADDHAIVRAGLRLLLERQPDMEVVAEAGDGVEALERTLAERPNLAILDVGMPRLTGLQATRKIRAHAPSTDVLVLSMHDDERYLVEALEAGAGAYVLKREADQELVAAVRAVAAGERPLMAQVGHLEGGADEVLTPREREVVKLIAEAYTNRQIAEVLHVSEKTVESHRGNVLRKLGMRDRVELARYAIREGLLEP